MLAFKHFRFGNILILCFQIKYPYSVQENSERVSNEGDLEENPLEDWLRRGKYRNREVI
jgi:hypothetical protein